MGLRGLRGGGARLESRWLTNRLRPKRGDGDGDGQLRYHVCFPFGLFRFRDGGMKSRVSWQE